ncbi:MAG TPA: hypothetical protein VNK92_05965, partial [Vicinamibacterales bacterium]|nr:hypothetical protein [Vicinamibacterales bacterium]
GLADLAMYEGRFEEAVATLERGIAADRAAGNQAALAAKHVALAEAYQALGRSPMALGGMGEARRLMRAPSVLVPASAVLLAAGRQKDAEAIAAELDQSLEAYAPAYAHLVQGRLALARGRVVDAIEAFRAAAKVARLWLVRFELGVAYVQAGRHAEALVELEACRDRRGEAAAVFLDDVPTYRVMAPLAYWLGRAQEGLNQRAQALRSYQEFLSLRRAGGDPLAADARRRLEALSRSGSP